MHEYKLRENGDATESCHLGGLPPDRPSGQVKQARPGSTERHEIPPLKHARTIIGLFSVTWYTKFNLIGQESLLPYQTGEHSTRRHLSTNRHIFKLFLKNFVKFWKFNMKTDSIYVIWRVFWSKYLKNFNENIGLFFEIVTILRLPISPARKERGMPTAFPE